MSSACPSGWLAHGPNCYKLEFNQLYSWSEAAHACVLKGAHLASLENESELKWLTARISYETKKRGEWVTEAMWWYAGHAYTREWYWEQGQGKGITCLLYIYYQESSIIYWM